MEVYKNQPLNSNQWNRYVYNCDIDYDNYRHFIFTIDDESA
jgi:hypothetical protein